jgi:peptide/nickel transport system substrate-binding protein
MAVAARFAAAGLIAALALVGSVSAAEAPKRGGTLTYMIPADAPPSFEGHRESTSAIVHGFAPFYSLLVRINPDNPASTTEITCDLCTAMAQPTDGGKTYTFVPYRSYLKGFRIAPTHFINQDLARLWRGQPSGDGR